MTKRRKKLAARIFNRWAKAVADTDYIDIVAIVAMRGKK